MSNVMRIAIVGAGPAGFYAAEALLRSGRAVEVDLFERLPTPYGLVRAGVAPDHQVTKTITKVFDRIATMPGFAFRGNVTVGKDISVELLKAAYDAVLISSGASNARTLDIPGAHLPGCHPASAFVGWCNGHPDFSHLDFDLSHDTAVVIGHGNVAADVCRLLLKSPDQLAKTDITKQALNALRSSKIRTVHLVGRSAPSRSKFGPPELAELCKLDDCVTHANHLFPADQTPTDLQAAKNWKLLSNLSPPKNLQSKRLELHFGLAPSVIQGADRVTAITFEGRGDAVTSDAVRFDCGLIISSIGYKSSPIDGVPFDVKLGTIPNEAGRIFGQQSLYVAGWIKRGPSGVVGTNRGDSVETVQALLNDLPSVTTTRPGFSLLENELEDRGVRVTSYSDWLRLNLLEVERGRLSGKPREKFTRVDEMIEALFPDNTPHKSTRLELSTSV